MKKQSKPTKTRAMTAAKKPVYQDPWPPKPRPPGTPPPTTPIAKPPTPPDNIA